MNGDFISI